MLQAAPSDLDLGVVTREIEALEHIHALHHAHSCSLDRLHSVS
ncbi:MAG: hypothetical protein ACOYOE_12360 [Chlorobium sp.]